MLLPAERVAEPRRAQRLDAHDPAITEAHAYARRQRELSDWLEASDPSAPGVSGMRSHHGLMAFLADNECVHGRLPTDRTAACGCFPSELPAPLARRRPPTVTPQEAASLARPRRGMTDADLTRLARDHRVNVERQLNRYGRHVAEEAVAEALAILVRVRERLDPDTGVAYFATVARHEAIRLVSHRRASHSELREDAVQDFDVADVVPERIEARERLLLLAKLKPDERTALVEKALGYSYDEIAARHSWTYTKVNRCIVKGRARLLATAVPSQPEEDSPMAATTAAPYGRKRDGTPKRRPGRQPRKPTVTPQEAASMITFDKLVEQTESELGRVAREVDIQQGVVTAATAKLEALQEQRAQLTFALDRLKDAARIEVPA